MKQKDIDEFLQGHFELDCPLIELIPCVSDSEKANLSGSGYISLNKNGHFDLKVYVPQAFPINEVFEKLNWEPGKVIGDEAFYDLIAHDMTGNSWKAERLIPDKNSGPNGSMILAKVPELLQIEKRDSGNSREFVQLHFNEVVKVPLNTVVLEQETVGETTRKSNASMRLARFEVCKIYFEIEENEGHTRVSAVSDSIKFTETTTNRIFESFSFVTSHSESWSLLIKKNNGNIETRIRAVKKDRLKSRIPPPISYQRFQDTGSVWRLFGCYLGHVIANEDDYFHPIYKEVYAVIESGKASLDVEALTLSVSIESLLKEEMNDFYEVTPELSKNVDIAKNLVSGSGDLDNDFKNRIIGSLSSMNSARAKDILFSLRDKDIIDKSLVKTYGDLRNKSAHGAKSSGGDIQNYFNQVSSVLVLFFQLVFLVIKYDGEYTDYGTYGYPTKKFSTKKP